MDFISSQLIWLTNPNPGDSWSICKQTAMQILFCDRALLRVAVVIGDAIPVAAAALSAWPLPLSAAEAPSSHTQGRREACQG